MKRAIDLALQSKPNEIPIGCIILKNNKIIASATNKKEINNDVTAHAEIIAIKQAQKNLNTWHLDDCDMYVTLEPCPMCAWAILQSRIKNLYFGSYNLQYGAFGSIIDLKTISASNINVYGGICEDECDKILDEFFKNIRGR